MATWRRGVQRGAVGGSFVGWKPGVLVCEGWRDRNCGGLGVRVHGVAATMALPKGLIRRQRGRDRNREQEGGEGSEREVFLQKDKTGGQRGTDRPDWRLWLERTKGTFNPDVLPWRNHSSPVIRHCSSSLLLSYFLFFFSRTISRVCLPSMVGRRCWSRWLLAFPCFSNDKASLGDRYIGPEVSFLVSRNRPGFWVIERVKWTVGEPVCEGWLTEYRLGWMIRFEKSFVSSCRTASSSYSIRESMRSFVIYLVDHGRINSQSIYFELTQIKFIIPKLKFQFQ